ncbi:MAG: adenosylcobinamide amidohydrolase [Promethearchaeota archaeon]
MKFNNMKSYKCNIPDIEIYFNESDIVIYSKNYLECLSNAAFNGGRIRSNSIVNHHVSLYFDHSQVENILNSVKKKFNLSDSMIGLLTAVKMNECILINEINDNVNYSIVLTAGILNPSGPEDGDSNLSREVDDSNARYVKPGTINIILLIDAILTEHALVNLIITITEAKTLILKKFDLRTKSGNLATGTSTDTIVVCFTNRGKSIEWSGYATKFGQSVGQSVMKALNISLREKVNFKPNRPILDRLLERGINKHDLINAIIEMYEPHSSVEDVDKLKGKIEDILCDLNKDYNLGALLLAGIRLNEEVQNESIPNLSKDFFSKESPLINSDEIIGTTIANYIGGTRGVKEFYKLNKNKPRILKKLNNFLDNTIGGLIAGISSLIFKS